MGERKGQNKYYPPDFDPKKHKSLNGYHGTHALRERARKLDQGILIIRFEMPYNIWCDGCKSHIAMGVRYNAEKKKVGMYFSTPIHEFKMKCHLCDQHFIIRTDPQNLDYVIESGARRKEQRWNMAENEQIVTEDKNDIKRLSVDPMFNLEHEMNDKSKLVRLAPTLKELEEVKSEWKDDYKLNSMMRDIFRTEKKAINEEKKKDQDLMDKWNLDIKLVKENPDDIRLASMYKYNLVSNGDEALNQSEKRKIIETQSIFDASKSVKKQDLKEKFNNKKDLQMNSLVNQLNKSSKEKILSNSGFNVSITNDSPNKSTLNNLVKLKKNKVDDEKGDTNNTQITSCLVSNDYGSDSSTE